VGKTESIKVIGTFSNDRIQAVKCEVMNKTLHITISTSQTVNPYESNTIGNDDWNDIEPFTLYGVVGLQICSIDDPLALLPGKIKKKIYNFIENESYGGVLKFAPTELSPSERSMVHEFSKNNGLVSRSEGKDNRRRLILTKSRTNIMDRREDNGKQKRITDAFQFATLNIVNENPEANIAGIINEKGIDWKYDNIEIRENVIIILRGLPGSGKSHLSKSLVNEPLICSADSYFYSKGEYQFDKDKLSIAHSECYTKALNGIKDGMSKIIIDNTNSRLSEYKKYIELAKDNGYQIVILEIYCHDKKEAIKFATRSKHMISNIDSLKMLSRWEKDDSAILLKAHYYSNDDSYISIDESVYSRDITFKKWLVENKLFHHNTKRRKTHICMEVGDRSLIFLDIPDKLYDEFLERYADSGLIEGKLYEPKFICEYPTIGNTDDEFRMFFDIDDYNDREMVEDTIHKILVETHRLIGGRIHLTSCIEKKSNGKFKNGLHIHCPESKVTFSQAKKLCKELANILSDKISDYNWEQILDSDLYNSSRSLRMFGSRKPTKGEDIGRMYKYHISISNSGEIYRSSLWGAELLKELSVRIV
jgi:predicted kinase